MKKLQLLVPLIIIMLLLLTGGCVSKPNVVEDTKEEATAPLEVSFKKKYHSVSSYSKSIHGEHLKNGILSITKEQNYLHFELKVQISPFLQEKMLNTEAPFYFNIADVTGQSTLSDVTAEPPIFVKGDLDKLKDGNYYIISQSVKLIEDVPAETMENLLLPETYELEIVNEDTVVVAVFIGLDIDMLMQQ